ncbi:MAG: protein kinase [Planctomycetaceae bacterium]|nr:protein kinase [Planctomycetaceae bacterium]
MTRTYQSGDEPVPGMRLINYLGQGGIGVVWKASAPGGTEVALKFISLGAARGLKEFSALRLMKRIRHPNLMPVIAYWMRDAHGRLIEQDTADVDELKRLVTPISPLQATVDLDEVAAARPVELIVAMGLGDRDLAYRLQECQRAGLAGIPADELLDYMTEAAKAIDFLNSPRHDLGEDPVGIQHCDIKPFNIMVVGDAVQVCDFGLAQAVGDIRSTSTSSGTIAYVAPELLDKNEPSRATDQYSLAVTYYELRTGRLPYHSDVFAEVLKLVMRGELDLTALPEGERDVIRRATALDPAARFPTVMDMVRALRHAVSRNGDALPEPRVRNIRATVVDHLAKTQPAIQLPVTAELVPDEHVDEPRGAGGLVKGVVAFVVVIACSALITWGTWRALPQHVPADALSTARQQIAARQYQQAIPVLDELIAADGHDAAEAYLLRGTCYLELNDASRAEADLSEAVRRRGDDFRAYSRRAKARLNAGYPESAIDDYTKALEIQPAAADYHGRGVARAKRDQHQQAHDDFTAALKLAPDNATEIYEVRAFVAEKLGRSEAFDRDLHAHQVLKAHDEVRTDHEWLDRLAEIFGIDRKDTVALTSRAIATVESICQDSQFQQAGQLDLLAMLYASRGDYELAIKHATAAVKLAGPDERPMFEARLRRYEQHQPFVRDA